MIIKKINQTTPIQAQVVDGYSQSISDAYSANYVNELLNNGTNFIIINASDDTTYSYNTAWAIQKVDFNQVLASSGNKLTFNTTTKKIVVGSGVNYVRISGLLGLWGMPNTHIEIQPRKNDSSLRVIYHDKHSSSGAESRDITPFIVPVQEGDTIDLAFNSGHTGTYTLLTRPQASHLMVEVVDIDNQTYQRHKPETGSNGTATYIKHEDGTLIQYGRVTLTTNNSRSAGGLTYYSIDEECVLPYNFIDNNYVVTTDVKLANMNIFCQSYGIASETDKVRISFIATNNNEERIIDFICIGRWK